MEYGVSFSQLYAKEMGLDPHDVYGQIMTDLKPSYVRLAAYWSDIEKQEGVFDFTDLDYYMDESKKNGVKVVLTVGQKAPRWPECYIPSWFDPNEQDAEKKFQVYVSAVVERYKTHEALELWQVENEPFIRFPFGECTKYKESWVEKEVALVRSLDTAHNIVITDSGEMGTWRKARKTGDMFGTTLYRIVRTSSGMRIIYDIIPASAYRLKAKLLGVSYPDHFFVSELQAEPWFDGGGVLETPLSRQYETMTKDRFLKHIEVARRTGASRAYLWGVEWWYWLKITHGESSMWDAGKEVLGER